MARIAGVELPKGKLVWVGLTSIYGIGETQGREIVSRANIDPKKRVSDLNDREVNELRKIIEKTMKVEGALRREVQQNVRRLIDIGCYRGLRHKLGLPARGQRTRHNARTRKGKRKTVATRKKKSALGVKGG